MFKFGLFLVNQRGYVVLNKIIEMGLTKNVGFVVSYQEMNVKEKYYDHICQLCMINDIKLYDKKEFLSENIDIVLSVYNVKFCIAIGWQYLLAVDKMEQSGAKLIVFHDALLPRYRGFAPTPTAILNGEEEIGVTALFAIDKMDAGEIILQCRMQISDKEYIKDIIERQSALYAEMAITIINKINKGTLTSYPQDEAKATYSIWRNEEDCQINWNESNVDILRLIRAVGDPYLGAYTYYEGRKIKIIRAELEEDITFEQRDTGKIWSIIDGQPIVICKIGLLRIVEAREEDNSRVIFTKLRRRFG